MKELNLKLIIGVCITIISATAIIISLISGLCCFAREVYDDVYSFPVRMSANQEPVCAGFFVAKKHQTLTFWLKVPDRRIENQDYKLKVSFYKKGELPETSFTADFRNGHFRSSSEQGQYYKIGSYYFQDGFDGFICYRGDGDWSAPYNGSLVIRRLSALPIPLRETTVFFIGITGMLCGIIIIAKNRNT